MKKRIFFCIIAFSTTTLFAQSKNQGVDKKEIAPLEDQVNQRSSPMMMFDGDGKKSPGEEAPYPRNAIGRKDGQRETVAGAASANTQVARGTASELSEEEEVPNFPNIIKDNLREQFFNTSVTTSQHLEETIPLSNLASDGAAPVVEENINSLLAREIKINLKQQYLAELALETLQDAEAAANKLATVYNTLPEFKKTLTKNAMALAEKTLVRAQEADLTARAARKKAYEMNFDREWKAYKTAEQAWDEAIIAYSDLKEAFQNDLTLLAPLEDYLNNAEVREALWKAYEPWINARKTEQKIAGAAIFIKADAEEARDSWDEVVEDYQAALSKARKAAFNDTTLIADLQVAEARSAIWSEKITEINEIQNRAPIDLKAQEQARLEATQKQHQDTIEAIHKEQYQRSYHHWPLPKEPQAEGAIDGTQEGNIRTSEEILPAKIPEKELASLGKELFKKERRARAAAQAARAIVATTEHGVATAPAAKVDSILTASERSELAHSEIIIASLQLSAENEARWAAREKADQLLLEAAKIASAKKDKLEMPELFEMDENKSVAFSSFPKNLSVIGSTVIDSKLGKAKESAEDKAARDLQKAMDAASKADSVWEALVHQAEKNRVNLGGVPLDPSDAIIFWEEADKKAFLAKKEKEKIQKKEAIAATHKEDWQINTIRWEARMNADQCNRVAKETEEQAEDLLQEQAHINLKDGLRSKNAKRISEEVVEAKTTASTARAAATEAEEQWSSLANNHRSVIATYDQEAETIKAALEKLKLSDQTVSNLWYEVTNAQEDDEIKEETDPVHEQARINKEATLYKTNLLAKRTALLAESFEKVDKALATAKRKYERSQAPEKKAAAKLLYDAIDEQETAAQQNYAQKAQEAAVTAAREKKPEAAWEHRLTQSEKEKIEQEKAAATMPPAAEAWADEHQRSLARATAITEADRKAVKVFEKEKKRLADIAMLWEEIIEAKQRADRAHREKAAQAYANGDMSAWSTFSPEEREQYDQDVILADKIANEETAAAIAQAEEAAKLARAQVRINPSELFIKNAQKAQAALSRLQDQESERQRAIEVGKWSKQTHEERRAALEKHVDTARAQQEAIAPASEEYARWQEAIDYLKHATQADADKKYEKCLIWRKAAEQEEASAGYYHEASSSDLSGNADNAKLWKESAQQCYILAERYASMSSRLDLEEKKVQKELNDLDQFALQSTTHLKESAEYLKHATTADRVGTPDKAKLWRQAAEQMQQLSLYEKQLQQNSLLAQDVKKEVAFNDYQFDLSSASSLESSDCLKKSIDYFIKAAQTEHPKGESLWKKAADEVSSVALKIYQAEQAVVREKKTYPVIACFLESAKNLALAAEFTEKKIEAETVGTQHEITQWNEAIEDILQSSKYFIKASECKSIEADYIKKEGQSWHNVAYSFYQRGKKLSKAIEADQYEMSEIAVLWREVAGLYGQAIEPFTEKAEADKTEKKEEGQSWGDAGFGLHSAAEKLVKAIEVEQSGMPAVATLWRQSAELQQRSFDWYVKAVRAYATKNTNKGNSWTSIGNTFITAADQLGEAIEVEVNGNFETAALWRKVAELKIKSTDHFLQAAETSIEGDDGEKAVEHQIFYNTGLSFFEAARNLGNAIKAETSEKPEVAKLWKEVAAQQQQSIELYAQATKARAAGQISAGNSLHNAGFCTYNAAKKLGFAIETEEKGKSDIAALWREAAKLQQQSAEPFTQAAKAKAEGKTEEGESWHHAALGFRFAAEFLEKVIEAEINGQPELTKLWRAAAELLQRSVEPYTKAARAREIGKINAGQGWHDTGDSFRVAAEELKKAIEADAANKPALASQYREAATLLQQSSEFYTQAAKAKVEEKKEGASWGTAGNSSYNAAMGLKKAIEADEANKPALASQYRKAATLLQQSAEFYAQTARAMAAGKPSEGYSWSNAGADFALAASKLRKAIEVETSSKPNAEILAALWRAAAELQQYSAGPYTKAVVAHVAGKTEEGQSWHKIGLVFSQIAEKLEKAIEAAEREEPNSEAVAMLWCEVAELQQQSVDPYIKSARACAAGKTEEGQSWYNIGLAFNNAAKKLERAIEAEQSGKPNSETLAKQWREIAKLDQQSVKLFAQAAKARAAGKMTEGNSWHLAGRGVLNPGVKLEKAIQAEQDGKPNAETVAKLWREAAELQQQSVEPCIRAAKAHAAGNTSAGEDWHNAGLNLYTAGDKLEEAINVDENGRSDVATLLRNSVAQCQSKAKDNIQAAEAQARDNEKQDVAVKDIDLDSADQALQERSTQEFDHTRDEAKSETDKIKIFKKLIKSIAQTKAAKKIEEGASWHHASRVFCDVTKELEKAIKAEQNGKSEVALLWRQVAELQQKSTEPYTEATKAYAAGKVDEGRSWDNAGAAFACAAYNLKEAIEIEQNENPHVGKIVKKYREAARLQQQSAEAYAQATKALVAGKTDESIDWNNKGDGFWHAAKKLEKIFLQAQMEEIRSLSSKSKAMADASLHNGAQSLWQESSDRFNEAVEYLECAMRTTSSKRLILWKEAAAQNKKAAEQSQQGADARARGNNEEDDRFNNAGNLLSAEARHSKCLAKASEEEESGNAKLTQKWREAGMQNERSVALFSMADKARIEKKTSEYSSLLSAGWSSLCIAEKLGKAIDAEKSGKENAKTIAQSWGDAAELQKQSVDPYTQAAKAYATEKTTEGQSWYWAGRGFYGAAEKLAKAIEAEEAVKADIAKLWRDAANLQQQSVDHYTKAANAHVQGKTSEGQNWNDAGQGGFWAAQKLENAITTEEAGKGDIAKFWRDAAVLQQQSVESYTQAAKAYAAGKTAGGQSWRMAGHGFYYAAEKLVKAIEAEVNGKPNVAALWREAANLQQQSSEPWIKAVTAYATGRTNEGPSWYNVGLGFYNAANKLVNAIEADEKERPETAVLWRNLASQYQLLAQHRRQAVEAYTRGNEEKMRFDKAENSVGFAAKWLEEAASFIEKVAAVVAPDTWGLAETWKKSVAQYQTAVGYALHAAGAFARGEEQEGLNFNQASSSSHFGATRLNDAASAYEKTAAISSDKSEIAVLSKTSAKQLQKAVHYYNQAAEAYAQGKTEEGSHFDKAAISASSSTNHLKEGMTALEKASALSTSGQPKLAALWINSVTQHQHAADCCAQAAEAYAQGNGKEGERLDAEGDTAKAKADQLAEAAETVIISVQAMVST